MLVKLDVPLLCFSLFTACSLFIYALRSFCEIHSRFLFPALFHKKKTRATDYKRLHGKHEENIKNAQFKKSTVSHFSERAVYKLYKLYQKAAKVLLTT